MNETAAMLFWLLVALVVGQGLLTLGFVLALRRRGPRLIPDDAAPKAAVILCLRGADPFLKECLQGLLAQDYPSFDIVVVVDHPDDPARRAVQGLLDDVQASNLHVQFLAEALVSCSLKCSGVVQAVRALDDSCDFIAQLDADVIPHATWLRELATALTHERVGAATGNRWYMPNTATAGSTVRCLWNAAAVVQMYWYRIAWGGTLAIKTQVIRELNLLDKWSHAFCEDTMLHAVLRQAGWRVAFVPSLMMVNREDCDVAGFFYWVRRQLLTARLYHPAWWAIVAHGVITTIAPAMALMLTVVGFATGEQRVAIWGLAGFSVYQLGVLLLLLPIELAVRKIVRARGESVTRPAWLSIRWLVPSLLLTECVHGLALASAMCLRKVGWRGVQYSVEGPWRIRLQQYVPYQVKHADRREANSL